MKEKFCIKFILVFLLMLVIDQPDLQADALSPSVVTSDSSVSNSLTSDLELQGRWYGGPVYASAVSGNYMYFGTGGAIQVFKVKKAKKHDASSWQKIASIETSGVVRGLSVSGRYLYVADHAGALRILDISNPSSPREVASYKIPADATRLSVDGSKIYIAAREAGLVMLDVNHQAK